MLDETKNSIKNIDEVIKLLVEKNILYTNSPKTIFSYTNKKVKASGTNFNTILSLDDFKKIYDGTTFFILEISDENVDFKRDEEYYNWKHK